MSLTVTRATLNTDTPIVGVELAPYIVTRKSDGTSTTEDIGKENAHEGSYVRYRWFRSGKKTKMNVCSVHPAEQATLLNIATRTYHCDSECFKHAWREWNRNRIANGEPFPTKADRASPKDDVDGWEAAKAERAEDKPDEKKRVEPWIEVCQTRNYTVSADDVGHVLKLEVVPVDAKSGNEQAQPQNVITGRVIPAPEPPRRNLVKISHNSTPEPRTFTVATYNVLADLYCNSDMYGYVPDWALAWAYRRQNILKEIVNYNADILCLQEVQSDHYEDFFQGEMAKYGYASVYKKKTAQVFSEGKFVIDGCAIFFKKDKFALIKKYEVEFNKAALSLVESLGGATQKKDALNRLMKDNIALIVVLEALDVDQQLLQGKRQLLCVANTHIHANTEHNDVKLWQVHTLLKGLEKIATSAEIPMVVCGDFNSVPGSAAHSLLSNGRVPADHPELGIDPFGILQPSTKLSHPLPLVSAYTNLHKPCLDSEALERQRDRVDVIGEPLFTNCTKDFNGALDYVFYTEDALAPVSLLELPGEREVRAKYGGLPNTQWSSDHVCLMTEFQWGARMDPNSPSAYGPRYM